MTQDERAREAGLRALETTQSTVAELRKALGRKDWRSAMWLYALLASQAAAGMKASKSLHLTKAKTN